MYISPILTQLGFDFLAFFINIDVFNVFLSEDANLTCHGNEFVRNVSRLTVILSC